MLEQHALDYYLGKNGKGRTNCAVAVAQAVEDNYPGKGNPENYFSCGGGNAPDNVCGALHAALEITKHDPITQEKLTAHFIQAGGAVTCNELRANRKLPCHKCVELAATSLKNYSGFSA